MKSAEMTDALRAQLALDYPDMDWANPGVLLRPSRARSESPRFYMTVAEGINHFRRWTNRDREVAQAVAEFTGVYLAYAIASGSYVAFLEGPSEPIRFTAHLGLLVEAESRAEWTEDSPLSGLLPDGSTRIELSKYREGALGTLDGVRRPRYCEVCFLELPLTEPGNRHDDC